MKKLSVKPKNWLVSFHVASGGIWLGTALCIVVVAITKKNIPNGDELYGINSVLKFMDDWVIIPTANLSLITGGLLCWLTIWGFTKHYWVIVKWVATVTLITTGTIWLGPWLNTMTAISETERLQALHNPLYRFHQQGVIIGGAIQTACLLAIVAISIVKPWGRRLVKQSKDIEEVVSSNS
ncbi:MULTISPECIES: hypothetical protein [Nostocales]|uniref:Integral membrane protein n=3 Tax=Nostocales TaxID=1161 RepID=A0A0C1N4R5_9CYAN|nr:hypothetical protein [Tolypothrix bouteillei]KAF3889092.1 hypothetical protein DA73_0400029145 [Tolypothrix bouteillei VB521301]